ncbi:MAG TPA: ABC transporter permease [bacterium]|nr:ABC transporter permease [bacterium]
MTHAGPSTAAIKAEGPAGGITRSPRRGRPLWRNYLVSASAFVVVLVAWQAIIVGFRVPAYLAPSPLMVLGALHTDSHTLLVNTWPTLIETVGGFVLGNLIAIFAAVGFVHNRMFRQSVYPLAVTLRTLPIVAISPILVLLLGNGYAPKIAIAALITFFPTLVNMADGLTAVDPQALELMHVLSASRWEVFRYLRWPTSLPYLFSALRIASTASLLGAIVGEWIGSNSGLGYLIVAATYDYRTPLLYATMAVASTLALVFFGVISVAERYVLSWRQPPGVGAE